jgi:predicted phosphodiesterase
VQVIEREFRYTSRKEVFKIIPFGDVHAGSIACDEDAVEHKLKELAEPNTYAIGMGDWFDAILRKDKRFMSGGLAPWVREDDIIESQREWVERHIKPYKRKFIAWLTGNHEETVHQEWQDDVTGHICNDLGIPYGGYACFIQLKFQRGDGNRLYRRIHAWHGAGASTTDGAQMQRLTRLVHKFDADIYLMGHLHAKKAAWPERITLYQGKVKALQQLAAITGSWLKGYYQPADDSPKAPSYVEVRGYPPTAIGSIDIYINPDKQRIWQSG